MAEPGGRLLRRPLEPGSTREPIHRIDPTDAGWRYVGFEARRLAAGHRFFRPSDDREVAVIALEGRLDIVAGGQRFEGIGTRDGIFDARMRPHER